MLFARVVIPGIIAAITGPSWPTHVSHSASYTVRWILPIAQAAEAGREHIGAGRLRLRQVAVEDFVLTPEDEPFTIVFACRVGALDGRDPQLGAQAMVRLAAAVAPGARVFIDGGQPLRELRLPES